MADNIDSELIEFVDGDNRLCLILDRRPDRKVGDNINLDNCDNFRNGEYLVNQVINRELTLSHYICEFIEVI